MPTSTILPTASSVHSNSASTHHRAATIGVTVVLSCVTILVLTFLYMRRRRRRRDTSAVRPSLAFRQDTLFTRERLQQTTHTRVSNNDASSSVILIGRPATGGQNSTGGGFGNTEDGSMPSSSMVCNPRTTPTTDSLLGSRPHPYAVATTFFEE